MRGALFVFSGLDGAGKSTQIELLVERLKAEGRPVSVLWTRGGYTSGVEGLKQLLRRFSRGKALPPAGRSPQREQMLGRGWVRRAWLAVALLDLARVYGVQVRGWLGRGRTVICDRYLWDTLIDFRLNFPQERVEDWLLWKLVVRAAPIPAQIFVFLIPVDEALRRSAQKDEPFPDSPETLARRLRAYQELAAAGAGAWQVMDGLRARGDLANAVWRQIGATVAD